MRDWTKTLPNASFRGVPFYIDTEQLDESGRMVAIHEFVKSEEHATEDMRPKVRKWSVQGYIVGDTVDTDLQAFVETCSTPGNGVVVLPMHGTYTVKCTGCASTANTKQMGRVDLRLSFVEAGNDSAFATIPIGDRIASNLMDGMSAVIGSAIAAFAG